MVIKNEGNVLAKNVQVDVIEIEDSGKRRENFLPIPLRWTHLDNESRDILPKQTVYLDLFEQLTPGSISNIQFFIKFGSRFGSGVKDFSFLNPGKTKVTLRLYNSDGKNTEFNISATWDGQFIFEAKLI